MLTLTTGQWVAGLLAILFYVAGRIGWSMLRRGQ